MKKLIKCLGKTARLGLTLALAIVSPFIVAALIAPAFRTFEKEY